jgi:hypothetical protein
MSGPFPVKPTQGANMAASTPIETIGMGLDDGAWKNLSRDVAQALVRACGVSSPDDRTYSSVKILPTPSGQDLYVRSSLFG